MRPDICRIPKNNKNSRCTILEPPGTYVGVVAPGAGMLGWEPLPFLSRAALVVGRSRVGEEGSFSCARSLRAYISPVVNAVSERQSRRSGPASVLVRVRILLCAPFRPRSSNPSVQKFTQRFSRASETSHWRKNLTIPPLLRPKGRSSLPSVRSHPFSSKREKRIDGILPRWKVVSKHDGNERRDGRYGRGYGVKEREAKWNRWTRSEEIEPGTKNRLHRCSAPRQPAIIPLENLATRNFPPTVGCHLSAAVKHEPARSRWNPWKDGELLDSFGNRATAEIQRHVAHSCDLCDWDAQSDLKSSEVLTRGGDVNVKQEGRRIEGDVHRSYNLDKRQTRSSPISFWFIWQLRQTWFRGEFSPIWAKSSQRRTISWLINCRSKYERIDFVVIISDSRGGSIDVDTSLYSRLKSASRCWKMSSTVTHSQGRLTGPNLSNQRPGATVVWRYLLLYLIYLI